MSNPHQIYFTSFFSVIKSFDLRQKKKYMHKITCYIRPHHDHSFTEYCSHFTVSDKYHCSAFLLEFLTKSSMSEKQTCIFCPTIVLGWWRMYCIFGITEQREYRCTNLVVSYQVARVCCFLHCLSSFEQKLCQPSLAAIEKLLNLTGEVDGYAAGSDRVLSTNSCRSLYEYTPDVLHTEAQQLQLAQIAFLRTCGPLVKFSHNAHKMNESFDFTFLLGGFLVIMVFTFLEYWKSYTLCK